MLRTCICAGFSYNMGNSTTTSLYPKKNQNRCAALSFCHIYMRSVWRKKHGVYGYAIYFNMNSIEIL